MTEIKVTKDTLPLWEKALEDLTTNRQSLAKTLATQTTCYKIGKLSFWLYTEQDIRFLIGAISHKLFEFERQSHYDSIIKTPAPFVYRGRKNTPSEHRMQAWKSQAKSGVARRRRQNPLTRILDRIFGA
jgi:hypothetical protein